MQSKGNGSQIIIKRKNIWKVYIKIIYRADDNPETIKKRFQTFVEETAPIKIKY